MQQHGAKSTLEHNHVNIAHIDHVHNDNEHTQSLSGSIDLASSSSSSGNSPDYNHGTNSEDFLKIEAIGLCRCLEGLPLGFKLIIITSVAFLMIAGFSAWLIVNQSIEIYNAQTARGFAGQFNLVALMVNALQMERANYIAYMSLPSPSTYDVFQSSVKYVNGNMTNWQFLQWEKPQKISQYESNLQLIRNRNATSSTDALYLFNWYSDYIKEYNTFLSSKTKNTGHQESIIMQDFFLQFREARTKLRSFGYLAFTNRNISMNEFYFHTFVYMVASRDVMFSVFTKLATNNINDRVNTTLTYSPEFQALVAFENIALAQSEEMFCTTVNVTTWIDLSAKITVIVQGILKELVEVTAYEADSAYIKAVALLVLIIALAIIFLIVYVFLAIVLSQSIIGPWARMNMLQNEIMNKFIPRQFLKLFNIDNITSAKQGLTATKQLVLMKISLHNFWQFVADMSCKQKLEALNRIITMLHPIVKSFNGYVEYFKSDEIHVHFRDYHGCIKCAHKIHTSFDSINGLYQHGKKMLVSVALHGAQQVCKTLFCSNVDKKFFTRLTLLWREMKRAINVWCFQKLQQS